MQSRKTANNDPSRSDSDQPLLLPSLMIHLVPTLLQLLARDPGFAAQLAVSHMINLQEVKRLAERQHGLFLNELCGVIY